MTSPRPTARNRMSRKGDYYLLRFVKAYKRYIEASLSTVDDISSVYEDMYRSKRALTEYIAKLEGQTATTSAPHV